MNFHESVNHSRNIRTREHEHEYDIIARYQFLKRHKDNNLDPRPFCDRVPDIPEEDLHIIKKIYHKMYHDCGRKRSALMRYIKHFRETQEPKNFSKRLFAHINKLKRKALR
jgi:hypothetical protein